MHPPYSTDVLSLVTPGSAVDAQCPNTQAKNTNAHKKPALISRASEAKADPVDKKRTETPSARLASNSRVGSTIDNKNPRDDPTRVPYRATIYRGNGGVHISTSPSPTTPPASFNVGTTNSRMHASKHLADIFRGFLRGLFSTAGGRHCLPRERSRFYPSRVPVA